jgi:histidinol-phosphate phosphatase family protein
MKQRAVFLDRDGVLNPDIGYPHLLEDATLYTDVLQSLHLLSKLGFVLIVVTNQSGIGRGIFTLEDVRSFHSRLIRMLAKGNVYLRPNQFYICPHSPSEKCNCRKPSPGLILDAAADFNIDLKQSFLIGDKETDVSAGRAAGVATILLDRGRKGTRTRADFRVSSLTGAAEVIRLRVPSSFRRVARPQPTMRTSRRYPGTRKSRNR